MPAELANPVPGDSSSTSVAGLVDALLKHRLLEPIQAEELPALRDRFDNPRALARELIQRGWLTPYQVNQLFLGRAGSLLLGQYVLLERLGEGGMGQVFKARHQNLGRIAALKLIRKDRLANEDIVLRFHREIQAVAQLSHPNVVMAFDADNVGETHFFAMEYVEGTDLGKLVKQKGPLPVDQACDYVRQAALGLQHAHQRGLVHRDIKPSNLLLASRGSTVKVLDLGLARLSRVTDEAAESTLTNQGALMGTPDFIAPEQARNSHNIDYRADLYSLGCTLYYLLTGQVPFPAETSTEKLYKHWTEEAPSPAQLRPEVPPVISAVVRRLMAKRPEDRFPNAAALAEALTPPYQSAVIAAVPTGIQAAPSAMPFDPAATPVAVPVTAAAPVALPLNLSATGAPLAVAVATSTTNLEVHAAIPVASGPAPSPGVSRRALILAAAVCGLTLLAIPLAFLIVGSRPGPVAATNHAPSTTPAVQASHEQQAESEYQALQARFLRSGTDEEPLRLDLLKYRARYSDVQGQSVKAAELLSQLRSPLDELQRKQIPASEIYEGLPRNAVAVFGERRWRHWGPIQEVTLSPDGSTVASAGSDGIRLWNAKNGREVASIESGPVASLTFLDKGKVLVGATPKGDLVVWDLSEERKPNMIEGPAGPVTCLALSSDGLRAASALEDGTIVVWSPPSGKEENRLKGHKGRVNALAFSSDGKTLASAGSDQTVRVWDCVSGKRLNKLDGHEAPVRCVALGPGSQTVASGDDAGNVRLWDAASGKSTLAWDAHRGAVSKILWANNGKNVVTASETGRVRIWDPKDDEQYAELMRHAGSVEGLAYCPSKQLLASAGEDGAIRVWDLSTNDEVFPPEGHFGPLLAVAVAPDGQTVATGGADRVVRLWDTQRLKERAALRNHAAEVSALAFSPDGKTLASGGWDGMVRLWNPATGKERDSIPGQRGRVTSVAISGDGKTLASGSGFEENKTLAGDLRLWDLGTNRVRTTARSAHSQGITSVAVSPDGQVIASGGLDGTVRISEWQSAKERSRLEEGAAVECLAFHPGVGSIAVGDRDGQIKFWTVANKSVSQKMTLHTASITAITFSPDGKSVASADRDGVIYIWSWPSGFKQDRIKLAGEVHSLAFTPDGRHLATANGNGTAYLLRLKDYKPRQ